MDIEKIDQVVNRTSCSYLEAKTLLSRSEEDVLEAIILWEKVQRIIEFTGLDFFESLKRLESEDGEEERVLSSFSEERPKNSFFSSSREHAKDAFRRAKEQVNSIHFDSIFNSLQYLLKKTNATKIIVRKGGSIVLDVPATAGIVGTVFFATASLVSVVVCILSGCSIEIIKEDGSSIKFDNPIDLPATVASIKATLVGKKNNLIYKEEVEIRSTEKPSINIKDNKNKDENSSYISVEPKTYVYDATDSSSTSIVVEPKKIEEKSEQKPLDESKSSEESASESISLSPHSFEPKDSSSESESSIAGGSANLSSSTSGLGSSSSSLGSSSSSSLGSSSSANVSSSSSSGLSTGGSASINASSTSSSSSVGDAIKKAREIPLAHSFLEEDADADNKTQTQTCPLDTDSQNDEFEEKIRKALHGGE